MRDFKDLRKDFALKLDCYPCFLRQTVIALRLSGLDPALNGLGHRVMGEVLALMGKVDVTKSPAHATTFMHRKIRELIGADPFKGIKAEYNEKALGLYPALSELVASSAEPLLTASRLAIAGNVIDFGIFTSIDVEGTVKRALDSPLAVDDFAAMDEALGRYERVLYLLDNAGEIVFDRLLIEALIREGKEVTAVVKGGPVINDCTMADAGQSGLDKVCEVIDNGSDAVGTILEMSPQRFIDRFNDAGALVISKGQGNFETLLSERREIFYLLQAKCGVLSGALGLPIHSMLLAGNSCRA